MYQHLNEAIKDYLDSGHIRGDLQFIEAYLAATIHAIIDYAERFLKEDEMIKACKYANNILKHNQQFNTHKKIIGGVTFPISFPKTFEEIKVVWNYDERLTVRYPEQKSAFKKMFAGKAILETIEPLERIIANGIETK